MNKNQYYQEIYNRFGCITRARNCFLYTKKGIRLTDLYQENGRAILGWDGKSAFTFIKNTINRGQTGSFTLLFINCSANSFFSEESCLIQSDLTARIKMESVQGRGGAKIIESTCEKSGLSFSQGL